MNTDDVTLPELSDVRVDEIEEALFAAIAEDRAVEARRVAAVERSQRRRRSRLWLAGGAAAAVVVVAAAIAPNIQGLIVGSDAGSSTTESAPNLAPDVGVDAGADGGPMEDSSEPSAGAADDAGAAERREIVATASATLRVEDVAAAADRIGAEAQSLGGYVESMSIGENGQVYYGGPDGLTYPTAGAWVSVRVPADRLTELTGALSDVGEVTASQISRRDVTSEAIDLRARVAALQASVARLTDLMQQSASTADLIAAESALADRQSELESYQQQLTYLEDQVGMSSLTVTLVEPAPVVQADPAGFGDGIAAGWNGLVATLNGIVVALGFLLPWLAIAAVAWLIVWGVVRLLRRRRTAGTPDTPGE